MKSIERGGALREEEASIAWFYRMLRNAVIDHARRDDARGRALEMLARDLRDAAEAPHEFRGAICECVGRLAASLKPEYAAAIQRVEVDGASMNTFAEENAITANNAAVRVFRAREALRKRVRASCGTCAEHGCIECSCRGTAGN